MEIKYLQVLVMPNNEILCGGKTVGYLKDFGKYLNGLAITEDEAKSIKIALNAWSAEARSDEPHYTYTPEFRALYDKIKAFIEAK